MLEELTLEGQWFPPGSKSHVPGTLKFSPTEGTRLLLNGVLSEQDAMGGDYPVIHGYTTDGRCVTLVGCFTENATIRFPGYATARYYALFALVGMHLSEPDRQLFQEYRVRFWNLEEFVGVSGLSLKWDAGLPQSMASFPDAIVAIAEVSWKGNEQHNAGQPLHWARGKSGDEGDALMRHFLQRGSRDTDGMRHSAKLAWRALALLQKEIEAERKTFPVSAGDIVEQMARECRDRSFRQAVESIGGSVTRDLNPE